MRDREFDSMVLLNPAFRPAVEMFPIMTLSLDNLARFRGRLKEPDAQLRFAVVCRELRIPGPSGAPEVPLLIYRPAGVEGTLPCILHTHGGGFISGSARHFDFLVQPLVEELNCCLVSVDYRLAPETIFPGAIEDCYAALRWVFEQADELQIDRERIGVMGESAGGGLAAALALLARDRGQFQLAFQHLIYPMLDDRTGSLRAPAPNTGKFIWNAQNNRFAWSALLGREPGSRDVSPYAAPARAENLAGLPPTFLSCGALDLFVSECVDYGQRLLDAGVATEMHIYSGAIHGFDIILGNPISDGAVRDSRMALARFIFA